MKAVIFALITYTFLAPGAFATTERNIRPDVERLLHRGGAIMNAHSLDELGLNRSATEVQPWTSSYWPDPIGGIATRYQRKVFPTLGSLFGIVMNFNANKSAWKNGNQKMKNRVMGMSEEELARELSPAEKYDLLMGDLDFTLTNNVIAEIDFRYNHKPHPQTGMWVDGVGMAGWVGICDGWTAAALHVPRPVRTVRVRGSTGQMITFYPDDIKALVSHLFARTNQWLGVERVGNRCQDRRPDKDNYGRPATEGCHDIDAGIWHTTVMNRIGIDKRGFVIDIDNKTSVNNHPVFGYDTLYFNPVTGVYGSLIKSVVPLSQVRDGKEALRNAKATQLVGVQMHMDVLTEDYPTGAETDSPANDRFKHRITYSYDLELDDIGEILGGQFREGSANVEKQPDMMWMLAANQLAWSRSSLKADEGPTIDPKKIELWGNVAWRFQGDGKIPIDWFNAHKESAKYTLPLDKPWAMIGSPAPLAEMVYYLIDQARK